ncbi:hypothetical protein [Streptomyces liangshanensis]|uniref:hypothetical protein n=1 Tax=Streptomyces liangshanensis TaxID=2717324 RepID=UPI0036D82390
MSPGGAVGSAATAALPFLLRLARDPGVAPRVDVALMIAELADTGRTAAARFVDDGWAGAWARCRDDVRGLLGDGDPAMRRAAVGLVAVGEGPVAENVAWLTERWGCEEDAAARVEIVLALGAVVGAATAGAGRSVAVGSGGGSGGGGVRGLLDGLVDSGAPAPRLAAVHAWGRVDPAESARRVGVLVEILAAPDTRAGLEAGWAEHTIGRLVARTFQLLADDPGAATELATGLLAAPDPDVRVAALAGAGSVLTRWRSPVPALAPALGACLDDPRPGVRWEAAYLLAVLGHAAAPYAERLAVLLHDTGAGAGTRNCGAGTVGDAALWALTRLGDPRALPGLVERLYAAPAAFGARDVHSSDRSYLVPGLPGPHDVLGPLRAHAGALLPEVRALMRRAAATGDGGTGRALAGVLEEWEEDALPALPELVGLLADSAVRQSAATALAALGPGAAEALPALERCAAGADPKERRLVAWAAWRIGGDAERAAAVLGGAMTEDVVSHDTIRRLGELGPLAAPYTGRLRHLVATAAPSTWERTEAAFALWAVTGEVEPSASALEETIRPLPEGRCLPVMLRAVRGLTRIGSPLTPATRDVLRRACAYDGRLAYWGGWRGFVEDEVMRAAIGELVAGAGAGAG